MQEGEPITLLDSQLRGGIRTHGKARKGGGGATHQTPSRGIHPLPHRTLSAPHSKPLTHHTHHKKGRLRRSSHPRKNTKTSKHVVGGCVHAAHYQTWTREEGVRMRGQVVTEQPQDKPPPRKRAKRYCRKHRGGELSCYNFSSLVYLGMLHPIFRQGIPIRQAGCENRSPNKGRMTPGTCAPLGAALLRGGPSVQRETERERERDRENEVRGAKKQAEERSVSRALGKR